MLPLLLLSPNQLVKTPCLYLGVRRLVLQLYRGKIKSHLESICKLKIGATHTHALLSASVSKGLNSYM